MGWESVQKFHPQSLPYPSSATICIQTSPSFSRTYQAVQLGYWTFIPGLTNVPDFHTPLWTNKNNHISMTIIQTVITQYQYRKILPFNLWFYIQFVWKLFPGEGSEYKRPN